MRKGLSLSRMTLAGLILLASTATVWADIYYMGRSSDGTGFWCSCGTEAGSIEIKCPAGSGPGNAGCTYDQGFWADFCCENEVPNLPSDPDDGGPLAE